ncbi:hypothetical protein SBA3_1820039 [Candidatus Sulfopaludibacter sp. SbA3]|nr:hypothetical protein SBA3_1820039 [Candidatus Sulfopaludibacter sp. SbA3]
MKHPSEGTLGRSSLSEAPENATHGLKRGISNGLAKASAALNIYQCGTGHHRAVMSWGRDTRNRLIAITP